MNNLPSTSKFENLMLTEFNDIVIDKDDTIVATATQPTTDAVLIAFSDQTVRIFGQNANGKLQRLGAKVAQDILPTPKKVTSICCHPFIPYFTVIGMEEGKVIIWDAQNARHVSRDELMTSDVTSCCWLAHGRVLGLADAVGRVVLSAYDPQTSEFRTVQKVQRQGKVVRIVERTACTHNFYLNLANSDPDADKIYPHIGEGPLEIIVAWDKGDVIDIQDVQKVSLICSVPQGVYELLYVPELDSGCAISPQGDVITFGFESTAWRAKRQILNKTKIEFSTAGGICGIGGGRLAFVSSTMAQVKIYDIIQQQATAIDLDEQIDGFHGVTGAMQFVVGVGLLVPLSKQATFAIISDVGGQKPADAHQQAQQLRYEPIEQNNCYVSMLDRQLAEGSVSGQTVKSQFTVKEVLQLDNFSATSDVYFQEVANDGDLCDNQSILASNKPFRSGMTTGNGVQYTVISFKPPVFGSGNLQNQVLLQQQLTNESTTTPQFLQKQFNDGLKNNITALQTGGRAIRVCISTPTGKTEECNIGVKHVISKIIVGQALGAAKSAYVLVQGGNSFSVFEVGEGLLPNALEQFQLPENQYQVIDCCLFGKYIIAAVRTFSDGQAGGQQSVEYQLLKLTFAGKSSASLIISKPQGQRDIDVSAISVCNQHLFLWTSNSSLFYVDLRSFDRYTQVCRLTKDYLFSEKAQVKIQMAPGQEEIENMSHDDKDGPTICMGITLGSTFSLGTIQVNTVQTALSVDNPQHVLLAITYKGFNDIVQRFLELPCVTVLQINVSDLVAMISGAGAALTVSGGARDSDDSTNQNITSAQNAVNQCRTFDFTPGRVRNASIDAFGTIAAEVEANDLYKYLLLQFSSFTIQRFGLWNRALILYNGSALIKQLIAKQTDFAEDEAEASGDPRAEGLSMQTFLRFLSVRVGPEHRRLIARKDVFLKVRKDVVVVQGLFAPNLKPEVETHELQAAGQLVVVVSPALFSVKRSVFRQKTASGSVQATNLQTGPLRPVSAADVAALTTDTAIRSLCGRSGRSTNTQPLLQNARTTYALSRFVVSVRNNRFQDAYSAVQGSDSVEIWRSLAGLCVQNGYVELLRTCVSHIKCPAVSLLLRSYGGAMTPQSSQYSSSEGEGMNESNQSSFQGGLDDSGSQGRELAAVLAVGLGELPSGLQLAHRRPLLYSKLLQMSGLGIYALQGDQSSHNDQGSGQTGGSTGGLASIGRKAAVYRLAGRCAALGDALGANGCYTELFGNKFAGTAAGDFGGFQAPIWSDETGNTENTEFQTDNNLKIAPPSKSIRQAAADAARVREEAESNGVVAASQLAKRIGSRPALYEAAVRLENAAENAGLQGGAGTQNSAPSERSCLKEASRLFQRAGCIRRALQCAIQAQDDDLVYQVGSEAKEPQIALIAAGYFAGRAGRSGNSGNSGNQGSIDGEEDLYAGPTESDGAGPLERALILYSCSGYTGQAVELCFKTGKLKELSGIIADVITELEKKRRDKLSGASRDENGKEGSQNANGPKTTIKKEISPELLSRAGYELIQAKQENWALDDYNKFVRIGVLALAYGGAVDQALYCISQNVIPITAEIADLLTPEDISSEENQQTILTIGKLLFKAGLYQPAVKKFISVGNSFLALQALIKLGDVQKIIRFAQMARSKECMKAAANFLQTCNFRDEPQLLTTIVQFYQKAGAEDALVRFFVQCAREEIDVFNDYEKAMDALREAAKWIGRVIQKMQAGNEEEVNTGVIQQLEDQKHLIEQNGKLINGFLHLIEYARNNLNAVDAADTMAANSKKLLQAVVEQQGSLVKVEHILAFLAEFHAQRGEGQRVVNILTNMKQKGMDVAKYVQDDVLKNYGEQAGIDGSALIEENAGIVAEDGYDAPDVQTNQGYDQQNNQDGEGDNGVDAPPQVNDDMDDLDIAL